jgi:hypothetical protein
LAAAATEVVEASGSMVLELVGSPLHTDAGLHPVRTLLERRCGIDRTTDQTERLRSRPPSVAWLRSTPTPSTRPSLRLTSRP